jgi:hypothetical protein
MKNAPKQRVVYLLGAGHCGSTLLSLALNQHSNVLSVSELIAVNAQKCGWAGGEDLRRHEFWGRVATRHRQKFQRDFWSVAFKRPAAARRAELEGWGEENTQAFMSIAEVANVPMIVDASKQPGRLESLLRYASLDIRVIYLVRDSRALVHAYDRKYASLWHGTRKLARVDRRARGVRRAFTDIPWMNLRYEDMGNEFQRINAADLPFLRPGF